MFNAIQSQEIFPSLNFRKFWLHDGKFAKLDKSENVNMLMDTRLHITFIYHGQAWLNRTGWEGSQPHPTCPKEGQGPTAVIAREDAPQLQHPIPLRDAPQAPKFAQSVTSWQ